MSTTSPLSSTNATTSANISVSPATNIATTVTASYSANSHAYNHSLTQDTTGATRLQLSSTSSNTSSCSPGSSGGPSNLAAHQSSSFHRRQRPEHVSMGYGDSSSGVDFGIVGGALGAQPFTDDTVLLSSLRGDSGGEDHYSPHVSVSAGGSKQGHYFVKKSFHKPNCCHHCGELIWGLLGTCYMCEVCNFVVHDRCVKAMVTKCITITASQIENPVSHCWSDVGHFKKKICNVCRKRLEEYPALRCEICEYYCHLDCQDYVMNDCKECATYTAELSLTDAQIQQQHHWREGNLPCNSKCVVCSRSCWSAECLTGYFCEWCGITTHTACLPCIPAECDFDVLHEIMLPPYAVSLPRTQVLLEDIIGLSKRNKGRAISGEWSSSGDDSSNNYEDKKSSRDYCITEKDNLNDDYIVRVFDGNIKYRKHQFRVFSFNKSMLPLQAVEQALRAMYIDDDPRLYFLSEIDERDGVEHPLEQGPATFRNQLMFDQRKPAIILRRKDQVDLQMKIKVYSWMLRQLAGVPYQRKYITVKPETSVREVLMIAFAKFGVEHLEISNVQLIHSCLSGSQLSEHVMFPDDSPWCLMNKLKQESVRAFKLSRFYITASEDPHGPNVALFVGNLTPGLSEKVYEKILLEKLGVENRWHSLDVIYYEYGALVLLYASAEKADLAYSILRDSQFDDKQLLVMILPRIQPQIIPPDVYPLLVFVNVKSGGCQGLELISNLRKLLNPHQVFNLEFGGPLPGLYCFRNIPYYKIMVCGGDGTVGWALSCLDNVGQDAKCNYPPMAVIPLGTGNDLARVLRWGSGYTGVEDTLSLLKDVTEAEEVKLDRWTVVFNPEERDVCRGGTKMALQFESNNANEDNASIFVMNNYFGIGIDADLTLDFHAAREENPSKFNSRIHNKGIYLKMGLRKMVYRTDCKDLHKQIILEVDHKVIDLSPLEGIIILNILSWGGGANPWGVVEALPSTTGNPNVTNSEGSGTAGTPIGQQSGGGGPTQQQFTGAGADSQGFTPPNHYDGQLEVVGVTGVVHMGQIYSGLRNGIRIAQGGHIRITLKTELPVQVDGEPWVQAAGQVVVLRSALRATMLRKVKRVKRRNTDSTLTSQQSRQDTNDNSVVGPT